MKILKRGIVDPQVGVFQEFLKSKDFYHGKIDNNFGPNTQNAVILFQKSVGLKSDGIVGNQTYLKAKLEGFKYEDPNKKETVNSIEDTEILEIIDANSHKLVADANPNNTDPTPFDPEKHLIVVAIRGFKLDSMGKRGENDRRVYDDAHFIVTPRGILAFEGNTDPNGYRRGSGFGANKGMAMLDTGVWFFGKGPHKGRPAFRQACPFTVIRDGNPPYKHTGYHAINWHDGGYSTTSSLGCQTNKPNDFSTIRSYIYKELENLDNPKMYLDYKDYGLRRAFPYILIEEEKRRRRDLDV